jgi:chromosome segregation protein
VNPLALEEFEAMSERHQFLAEQLDDLKRTRTDLLGIIADVDARVEQVFAEAYADVEAAFEHAFARLFPAVRDASCSPSRAPGSPPGWTSRPARRARR